MRDPQFVSRHRGGLLSPSHHRQLMVWAVDCAVRVLPLTGARTGARLSAALKVAVSWADEEASVGEAQKAAWRAHTVARALSDPAAVYAARAVGHACATAHMADHSLGAALYALKALQAASRPIAAEKRRQLAGLPAALRPRVFRALREKGRPWGYDDAVRNPAKKDPCEHIEHAANCTCRPIPDKLRTEITKFKKRRPA